MTRSLRNRSVLFLVAIGLALGGCLSSVVDSSGASSRPDPLAGRWRGLGDDSGFQYQFLDSSRMVVTRSNSLPGVDSSTQVDTLPIAFEPGGFFFRWRYEGEFGRHYCFLKGDTLIVGFAAMGEHQKVYPRIRTSDRVDGNKAYGMWESLLCPNIYCLIDTVVIDSNGYLPSKLEQRKFGTEPFPVEFQDELLTLLVPARGDKYPFVHMVRNDSLWLLETGVVCASETDPCLPNSRLKMVRR